MKQSKTIVGWREWLSMPDLGIRAIKAKIDTGARTSALYTFGLKSFEEDGILKVKFRIHPLQLRTDVYVNCVADVMDRRRVSSSDGQSEMRYVIATSVVLGDFRWPVEMTLTNRDSMRFRMLLGRAAISGQMVVDPAKSYLSGRKLSKLYSKHKKKDIKESS
jgi:hypothetical protein